MPLVCYNKPNRTKPRHYSARDCGRIVAYARATGASDVEILAHIAQAYGVKDLSCFIYQVLDVLNRGALLAGMLTAVKALLTIAKGIKLMSSGKRSVLTSALSAVIPKRWIASLGELFIFIGALEAILSVAVIFLTSMANSASIYLLFKGVCSTYSPDYAINVSTLDTGDLAKDLKNIIKNLELSAK